MPDFDEPPEGYRVVPIPDEPIVVPFDRRRRAEDGSETAPKVSIIASPYLWIDPENIPLRDWLYGRLLVRRFLTVTIAPGGVGKSSLIVAEALAMVSGRDLVGVLPSKRLKVWLWNLEDPQEETARKVQAAAKHYHLTAADLDGQLFVNSGRDHSLVIAKEVRNGILVLRPMIENVVQQIRQHGIDVLDVDPFVSCHEVSENDNSAIDMIAKEWSRVAEIGNCAVHLVHHTRKAPAGTEVTTESSRGAKALTDAARVARAINQMTDGEGEKAGVDNHRLFFRAFNDKANLAPPVTESDWFKLASVCAGTGAEQSMTMELELLDDAPTTWTGPHVGRRLTEGMRTLAQLPMGTVGGYAAWPAYAYEWTDLLAQHEQGELERTQALQNRIRLLPSSREVQRMEQAICWPAQFLARLTPILIAVNAVALAHAFDRDSGWVANKRGGYADTWRERSAQGCDIIARGLRSCHVPVF